MSVGLVVSGPGSPGYVSPTGSGAPGAPATAGSGSIANFLTGALGGLQNAASWGSTTPGSTGIAPISAGPSVPGVAPIDMTASNNATYAHARDVAGQEGRSQVDSLQGLMGAAGQLGGGAQAQGLRDVVENAAGQVGEVNRGLAQTNAGQALEVAKANQASSLAQRGQNISAQEAQARIAQEQAQMQFNNMQMQSQRQLELLRMALGFASSTMGSATSAGGGMY